MKKVSKIYDIEVEYEVIHRKVKNARLEIKTDRLRIVLPLDCYKDEEIIKRHEKWIYKRISRIKASQKESEKRKLDFKRTEAEFRNFVLSSVEKFSMDLGVSFNMIRFKRMKTRWGSCSSKKNVNINIYLMYLPIDLIEYVVFHEITHLVEMGHNKRFWNIISHRYPDYKNMEDELLIHWLLVREIIEREK